MSVVEELTTYMATTEDLRRVSEHLFLDQQTLLPPAATEDRARQIGLLERMIRDRLASDELGGLITRVETETDGQQPIWLAATRRDHERELRRPADLQQAFASVGIEANAAWKVARQQQDWSLFAPWLERMVDINLRAAQAAGYTDHPHDALLGLYEPGPTAAELDRLFDDLTDDLVALNRDRETRDIVSSPIVDGQTTMKIAADIARLVGFDFDRGGLAFSPHGYTNPGGPNDIRVTFRADQPIVPTVSTILHELGHALYEQGVPRPLWGTSAGRGIMPYLHESQSKFWENIVGRRADLMPALADIVSTHLGGGIPGCDPEAFLAGLTKAPSSMIRTESDEVSFNLHIVLRWEVERRLLSGTLAVGDVPEFWNARCEELFGRAPANLAEGALQDPHWCRRYMGLFTSYVVGNLASAQLAEAMAASRVSVADACERRSFTEVLQWLRTHVHAHGRALPMGDVLVAATGRPLDAEPYRRHLNDRYSQGH